MSTGQRKPGETFAEYRERLKREQAEDKLRRKGVVLWDSRQGTATAQKR